VTSSNEVTAILRKSRSLARKDGEPFRPSPRLYRGETLSPRANDERHLLVEGSSAVEDLATWLEEGYPQSVRTAYLILGNRLDAEDAVQEAFLRAWKFRNALAKESSFKPWLYRVVVNSCNSKLRQEIPHRDRRSDEDLTARDLAGGVERLDLSHDVASALRDLPDHLRVVVVLRYYADLSERDIALAIGRKPGTVKSRLNEARRRLAEHPALRDGESDASNEEITG
jgi:RNA polymerase sigma-70 factor, ECF subfamily